MEDGRLAGAFVFTFLLTFGSTVADGAIGIFFWVFLFGPGVSLIGLLDNMVCLLFFTPTPGAGRISPNLVGGGSGGGR